MKKLLVLSFVALSFGGVNSQAADCKSLFDKLMQMSFLTGAANGAKQVASKLNEGGAFAGQLSAAVASFETAETQGNQGIAEIRSQFETLCLK
jgi:hypothetical protein